MNGEYRDLPIISDPYCGDIAPTCVAHYAKDKSTRLVKDNRFDLGVRPYTLREWARLQGLPDSFEFPVSSTAAYKQIGNGVSVPVVKAVLSNFISHNYQEQTIRRPAGQLEAVPLQHTASSGRL